MARWPAAEALAAASRDEVLAAWAGLGYYSRARNLYACAQAVAREGFPTSEAGLRALPGVGAYTAAAIAAIAFDEPAAVVDGNVERVIARLFAVEQPLPAAKPAIRKLAATLTPLGPARRLRASHDGPRSHGLHAALAILSGLPGAKLLHRGRSRRRRALPRQVSEGRKACSARRRFRDRSHRGRRSAHSFAAAKRQGPARRHDGSAVLGVGGRCGRWQPHHWMGTGKRARRCNTPSRISIWRCACLQPITTRSGQPPKPSVAIGRRLKIFRHFALPAVMKKAVASGLDGARP